MVVVEVPQWLTADDFISCKLMLKIDPIHATSTCFFFLYKCLSAVMNYLRRLDLSHVRSGNWRTFISLNSLNEMKSDQRDKAAAANDRYKYYE